MVTDLRPGTLIGEPAAAPGTEAVTMPGVLRSNASLVDSGLIGGVLPLERRGEALLLESLWGSELATLDVATLAAIVDIACNGVADRSALAALAVPTRVVGALRFPGLSGAQLYELVSAPGAARNLEVLVALSLHPSVSDEHWVQVAITGWSNLAEESRRGARAAWYFLHERVGFAGTVASEVVAAWGSLGASTLRRVIWDLVSLDAAALELFVTLGAERRAAMTTPNRNGLLGLLGDLLDEVHALAGTEA